MCFSHSSSDEEGVQPPSPPNNATLPPTLTTAGLIADIRSRRRRLIQILNLESQLRSIRGRIRLTDSDIASLMGLIKATNNQEGRDELAAEVRKFRLENERSKEEERAKIAEIRSLDMHWVDG